MKKTFLTTLTCLLITLSVSALEMNKLNVDETWVTNNDGIQVEKVETEYNKKYNSNETLLYVKGSLVKFNYSN